MLLVEANCIWRSKHDVGQAAAGPCPFPYGTWWEMAHGSDNNTNAKTIKDVEYP